MADLKLDHEGNSLTVQVSGKWALKTFSHCLAVVRTQSAAAYVQKAEKIFLDGAGLELLDSAGSKVLADFILKRLPCSAAPDQNIELRNFSAEQEQLFGIVFDRLQKYCAFPKDRKQQQHRILAKIGLAAANSLRYLNELFNFFGLVADSILRLIFKLSLFRPKELVTQIEEACLKSIPVISLVTFLIGIVVTYLMAMQVEKYGGHIFVVNGVALAMCRELSPVIVAVVMAGRSGSAYTAQIGAMRMNEEVDAITSLGLSVQQVLVLPRFFALILSMPLLVFIGDIVGIFGGLVIAESYLGLSSTTFIDRLQTALPIKHFWVGMIKAPVFASIIALIGCRRGLNTEMNARSVGLSTTATVVESIVLVILLNAAFAVIFAKIGL